MARQKKAYGAEILKGPLKEEDRNKGVIGGVPWTTLSRNLSIAKGPKPVRIFADGECIAVLVDPEVVIYACEYCGENTIEAMHFQNQKGEWERLVLCNKCRTRFIYGGKDF